MSELRTAAVAGVGYTAFTRRSGRTVLDRAAEGFFQDAKPMAADMGRLPSINFLQYAQSSTASDRLIVSPVKGFA